MDLLRATGCRYYDGESLLDHVNKESQVLLQREPENKYDPFAIKVLTEDEKLLG
ncbi:MAG: HIRAN domain-containing protein [Ectobacillus sp.]